MTGLQFRSAQEPLVDDACLDLAEQFLDDEGAINTRANSRELAGEIQSAIENFIDRKRSEMEPRQPIPGES